MIIDEIIKSPSDTTRNAVIEGCGIKRDLKLAGLGHGRLLLQLTTSARLPAITTLHWESCLSFSIGVTVRTFGC